jgi:myo-inositol-1(or 4)-monophosphatase
MRTGICTGGALDARFRGDVNAGFWPRRVCHGTADYSTLPAEMHGMVNIAVRAARRAGELMVRQLNRLEALTVEEKSRNEFVTQVDRAAEEAIIDVIKDHYPEHAILAEESGASGDHEYQWIIDPLDGTTNFVHGFPVFSVSIAVARAGEIEHGVVYDPLRQEIFTASRGQGAQLDGHKIRVSKRTTLRPSLIATGLPYRANLKHLDRYLGMLRAVMLETAGIRRPGSAALDLCYVAAGRVDAFWELGLSKWDIAAGALMIREAGGRISDFRGGDGYLETGNVVAGNPKVYAALSKLLAPFTAGID